MSTLPIVGANSNTLKLSEIALRQPCKDVDVSDERNHLVIRQLIEDLFETLYAAFPVSGVGLAAPQIGVLLRVAVVDYTEEREEGDGKFVRRRFQYALINPKFTYQSEGKVKGKESCLSFSKLSGEVSRSQSVIVESLDHNFEKQEIKAEGWVARILQHELDHLDGVLYADRLEASTKLASIEYPYVRKARATIKSLYSE